MDALGNDLSPFCAFHKNEVTINKKWLICGSKMHNLGNEVNVESSGCLWSFPTPSTPVAVSAGHPGVFFQQEQLCHCTHRGKELLLPFPCRHWSWLRSQPPSWALRTGRKAMKVFLQGCYCCSGRAQLAAVINIWLCCTWKRSPRIDKFNAHIY